MRLFGIAMGYDEPFFYCGPWELLVHDNGWTIAKRSIVWRDGLWPTYWTLRPWRRRSKHSNGQSGGGDMKKWFCTDCEDTFNDETGERCPMCGFRRVVGPVKYSTAAECREAIWKDLATFDFSADDTVELKYTEDLASFLAPESKSD